MAIKRMLGKGAKEITIKAIGVGFAIFAGAVVVQGFLPLPIIPQSRIS